MYHVSKNAYLKFEQGVKQKEFLFHLYDELKDDSFMQRPEVRYCSGKQGSIKSYWFKTFSHGVFTNVYNLFYLEGKKGIDITLVSNYLGEKAFAY